MTEKKAPHAKWAEIAEKELREDFVFGKFRLRAKAELRRGERPHDRD